MNMFLIGRIQFRYQLYSSKISNIKDNKMQCRKNLQMAMFLINSFVMYDLNPNLQLDRNMNSPPIAHFRFANVVLIKKIKERKMAM